MLANQNLSAAADAIRSFKADFPDDGNAYLLEGTLQLSRRDLAAAEKSLTKAEQLNPDSVPAASGRIQVLLAGGKSAEARQYVQRLMITHPDRAGFLILGARTYATLKDFSAAEVLLRKTLQLDPSRSETYGLLAQLYGLQGKPDQALAEYQALAAAQPKSVSARTMVGVMLQATHRKQEAKEAYRELLAIDPSAPVAANNLAWMLAEDNENLDVALQLAQTAKAGLPESPSAADTLGWVYLRKGLASQAISEFTEALGRDPENAGFHYRLGFAYAQSGETIQARRSLERALALNGGAPEAAEARATLTRLSRIGL
jgi:tetratricopeptide (TPR) repeat protein